MTPERAADCEAIRYTLARYNQSGDRGRIGELLECFAEDGVMHLLDEQPIQGRAAIEARLMQVVDASAAVPEGAFVRHNVSNTLIEFDGDDEATVSSYYFVVTEVGPDPWGTYRDRLRRFGDRWLFTHRRVRVDGSAPNSRMA